MTVRRRPNSNKAFTLIELMIAALLSGMVLLAIYFVFISNTEQYYRQEQIVQMQERMRFATEYLKNDLRNAGRLAVVNGTANDTDAGFCRSQAGLTAIQLFEDDGDIPAVLSRGANGLAPDRIRLLIDSSSAIMLTTDAISGQEVRIAAAAQQGTAEARTLVDPGSTTQFESMFKVGYYLRVHNIDRGQTDLVPIAGVATGAKPTIQLTRAPCIDVSACAGRCDVNPVQLVEYRVRSHVNDADRTQLVRQVLDAENGNIVDGPLIIADYVVDLQLWGLYDTRAAGVKVPVVAVDPDPRDTIGNWPGGADEDTVINRRPQRLRGVNVLLATRTQREDPKFTVAPGIADQADTRAAADRLWFDLDANVDGYARVTTLLSVVSTPNLYRGLDK